MEYESLTGAEKVAIVILSLPQEMVVGFISQLADEDVHKALAAVSRMDEIAPSIQEKVLTEFRSALGKHDYAIAGGRMRITDEAGTREVDSPTGNSWTSAGVAWHEVVNVGETTAVYLVIETR